MISDTQRDVAIILINTVLPDQVVEQLAAVLVDVDLATCKPVSADPSGLAAWIPATGRSRASSSRSGLPAGPQRSGNRGGSTR